MAARRPSFMCVTSVPQMWTRPWVGLSSAPAIVSSVVLPEPEGPIMATISPPRMSSVTSSSAVMLKSPERYILLTASSWRMRGGPPSIGLPLEYHHRVYVAQAAYRYVRGDQGHQQRCPRDAK